MTDTWECTPPVRWVERQKRLKGVEPAVQTYRVLQQQYRRASGWGRPHNEPPCLVYEYEWRDIPTAHEGG